MLKKIMRILLCVCLILSICIPSIGFAAPVSVAPIVGNISVTGSAAYVTVTNPWSTNAAKIIFVATGNNADGARLGKLNNAETDEVSNPGGASTTPVTLSVNISSLGGDIRYFVMAEDAGGNRSSLFNCAPAPVKRINADANFKYVELTWPAAYDDFNAVSHYEVKRYIGADTAVLDESFGTDGVVTTTDCGYIDKFSPDMSVELENVTYTYTVAVVDHNGLRSDDISLGGKEMVTTVTTPVAAHVTLYPDEERTKESSKNMSFYFLEQGSGGTTNTNQSKGVSLYPASGSDRRPCRRTINTEAKTNSFFYFRVNTDFIGENDNEVTITITYYDDGVTPVNLDYFPSDVVGTSYESFRLPGGIPSSGVVGWREASVSLTNFSSTKIKSSWTTGQFRFFTGQNPNDVYLQKIKVQKTEDVGIANPSAPDYIDPSDPYQPDTSTEIVMPSEPYESQDSTINFFMCGDSITTDYETERYPQAGIGQVIGNYFNSNVNVVNLGVAGYSSKSFWDAEFLQDEISNIQEGDYVFIKFGHNDVHSDDRHTDPTLADTEEGSYKGYLKKYVKLALDKKANPVLITSIAEREYVGGVFNENESAIPHIPYVQAMRDFAGQYGIPIIDAYDFTADKLSEWTEEESRQYYMYLDYESCMKDPRFNQGNGMRYQLVSKEAYEATGSNAFSTAEKATLIAPDYPYNDVVHISEKGAHLIAKYIAEQISTTLDLPVKDNYVASYDYEATLPTLGNNANDLSITFGADRSSTTSNCLKFYYEDHNYNGTETTNQTSGIANYNGEACRHTLMINDGSQKTYMYFNLDTTAVGAAVNNIILKVRYYYDTANPAYPYVQYSDPSGASKTKSFTPPTTTGWHDGELELNDFCTTTVSKGWARAGQIRFYSSSATTPIYVSKVGIEKQVNDPALGAFIDFNKPNGRYGKNYMSFEKIDYDAENAPNHDYSSEVWTDSNGDNYRKTHNFTNSSGNQGTSFLYFKLDEAAIPEDVNGVVFTIEYYDDGSGALPKITYFKPGGGRANVTFEPVAGQAEGAGLKTAKITATDFSHDSSLVWSQGDFRIYADSNDKTISVKKLTVEEINYGDPTQGAYVTFAAREDDLVQNCLKFYYLPVNESSRTTDQNELTTYTDGTPIVKTQSYQNSGGSTVYSFLYFKFMGNKAVTPEATNVKFSVRYYVEYDEIDVGGVPTKVPKALPKITYFKNTNPVDDGSGGYSYARGNETLSLEPSEDDGVNGWKTATLTVNNFTRAQGKVDPGWVNGEIRIYSSKSDEILNISDVKIEMVDPE